MNPYPSRRLTQEEAASFLSILVKRELKVDLKEEDIIAFVKDHWPNLTFYVHTIHEGRANNPARNVSHKA